MIDATLTFVARTKSGVVQFVRRHNEAGNWRSLWEMTGKHAVSVAERMQVRS
jgi:hypothetical protein